MDRNPYEAPRAELGSGQAPPSRRTGWKAYAYALAALQLSQLFYGLSGFDAVRALDAAVTLVGIAGLFCFAYRRPVLERWFWRPWGVFNPLWDTVMGAWIYPSQQREPAPGMVLAYFVLMLLFVPMYVALIRYGYFSPEMWSKAAAKDPGSTAS